MQISRLRTLSLNELLDNSSYSEYADNRVKTHPHSIKVAIASSDPDILLVSHWDWDWHRRFARLSIVSERPSTRCNTVNRPRDYRVTEMPAAQELAPIIIVVHFEFGSPSEVSAHFSGFAPGVTRHAKWRVRAYFLLVQTQELYVKLSGGDICGFP